MIRMETELAYLRLTLPGVEARILARSPFLPIPGNGWIGVWVLRNQALLLSLLIPIYLTVVI